MLNSLKKIWNEYSQKENFSLMVILILGAAFLGQQAWVKGFFYDGGIYALLGKNNLTHSKWWVPHFHPQLLPEFFEHPPIYFMYLGSVFKIFGASWTSARVAGVFFAFGLLLSLMIFLKKQFPKSYWAYFAGFSLILLFPFLKKARYPNLDFPMALFMAWTYFFYYLGLNTKKNKYWIGGGLFLGLAFLMKGPPALMVLLGLCLHLLLSKKIKTLLHWAPWVSLLLSLAIFSLWPLSLWIQGEEKGFFIWFDRQIIQTIFQGRLQDGNLSAPFYLYIKYLLKKFSPIIFFALLGMGTLVHKIWKKKTPTPMDNMALLFLCWFLSILIPFSFMKAKFGHYLVPLYLPLAGLAGYFLASLKIKVQRHCALGIKILGVLAVLSLLIFPLTTKERRNQELFKLLRWTSLQKTLENEVDHLVMVGQSYDFYRFISVVEFDTSLKTYRLTLPQLMKIVTSQGKEQEVLENYLPMPASYRKSLFYLTKADFHAINREIPGKLDRYLTHIYTSPDGLKVLLRPQLK